MRTVGHMLHLLFLIGRYINDDIKPKTPYFEFYLLTKNAIELIPAMFKTKIRLLYKGVMQ